MDVASRRMNLICTRLAVGVVTVMVAGDLDIGTADAFRRQIRALLDTSCSGRLELDLSHLEFCDLAGMRAIKTVSQPGAETQHQVRITAAAPCLDILLHLCQIPALLGYVPPPQQAEVDR